MDRAHAARLLGVGPDAGPDDARRAFRARIRDHHPDLDHARDGAAARELIAAYRLLTRLDPADAAAAAGQEGPAGAATASSTVPPSPSWEAAPPPSDPGVPTVPFARLDGDTLGLGAPADEVFRLLIDAAHDIGEVTYLDRSVPILEVLCSFVGEPATSLVLTVQGRATFTEVFCTVESIEARPAPPTDAVVDVLQDAILARQP